MDNEVRILVADENREARAKSVALLLTIGKFKIIEATDGEDALNKIRTHRPNIVIIDVWMSKIETVSVIKRTIKPSGGDRTRCPAFIVTTSVNNPSMLAELGEAGADFCAIKPLDAELLRDRISKIMSMPVATERVGIVAVNRPPQNDDLETQVTKLLHRMGVPAHIKGYGYLRKAIIMSIFDSKKIDGITKHLYPSVAREFSTTTSRVERAIRHAIEVAWDRGDIDIINSYFGYTIQNTRGKPTNAEFIALLSDSIRLDNKITA